MDVELFNKKFEKNFFYGMDRKSDIIDYIILREADKMLKVDMETIDTNLNRVEYTIEKIKDIVIQLYRYVYLNEPAENQIYFEKGFNKDSAEIEQLIEQRINDLIRKNIISGALRNWEKSAIYITGGDAYHPYPGRNKYSEMQRDQWIQEIVEILETLTTMEIENKEQYYALFLDTKYSRTKNAQQQLKEEQEYLEVEKSRLQKLHHNAKMNLSSIEDKEIYSSMIQINDLEQRRDLLKRKLHLLEIEKDGLTEGKIDRIKQIEEEIKDIQKLIEENTIAQNLRNLIKRENQLAVIIPELPKQLEEIRAVFKNFRDSVKVPKQDVEKQLGGEISEEMQKYISQKLSDYTVISTLKEDSMDEKYKTRLNKKVEEIRDISKEEYR